MKRYSTDIRRQQIVRAALDIIANAGQEGLTMRNIAEKVGVTDAAIYKHFDGKKDILITMIHSIQQDLTNAIGNHTWKSDNPLEQLRELVQFFYQYLQQHHGVPPVLFFGAISQKDDAYIRSMRQLLEQTLTLFKTRIEATQHSGLIREDFDRDSIAQILLGIIQSDVLLSSLHENDSPLGQRFDQYWFILQRGIGVFHDNNVS